MVGCGSSARAANSPNAILPPELAMISSSSNARSTDCTPDLVDDSSANAQPSDPRSSLQLRLATSIFRMAKLFDDGGDHRVRQISAHVPADWILATVSCYHVSLPYLQRPEGQ